jgi:hypothetical protein
MDRIVQVYAVVRIDEYSSGTDAITVKEILPTMEQAEREVERLNRLNSDKGSHYFWQATRYFPQGVGLDGEDNHPKNPSGVSPLHGSES